MAKKKPIPVIPTTFDRPPLATDNARHAVWVDDDRGIRRVTAKNPGDPQIVLDGAIYTHTRETETGAWVYTRVDA
jgi:hypothetical protein